MSQVQPVDFSTGNNNIEVTSTGVNIRSYDEMEKVCRTIVNSGLSPHKTPQAVFLVVQKSLELGIGITQGLDSIAVINNRACIFGDLALALVNRHPDFMDIEETYDEETQTAKCVVKRKNRTPVVRKFSKDMAVRAELWQKGDAWRKYPERMLQLRARAFALRDSFPDALKGIGIAEEVSDFVPTKKANVRVVADNIVLPDEAKKEEIVAPEWDKDPIAQRGLNDIAAAQSTEAETAEVEVLEAPKKKTTKKPKVEAAPEPVKDESGDFTW